MLVTGTLSASADDQHVAKATLAAFKGSHDVVVGGSAVAGEQIGSTVGADLGRAELLAFPLLLILSLIFFRGRATLMPLVTGITTVLGTFLVLRGVNSFYGLSTYALNLVIGMGLGLAVDYTLFIVTRYRQELADGASEQQALRATMTKAGVDRLLLGRDGRVRAGDAGRVPRGLLEVDGDRRRRRRARRRGRRADDLAGAADDLGREGRQGRCRPRRQRERRLVPARPAGDAPPGPRRRRDRRR